MKRGEAMNVLKKILQMIALVPKLIKVIAPVFTGKTNDESNNAAK